MDCKQDPKSGKLVMGCSVKNPRVTELKGIVCIKPGEDGQLSVRLQEITEARGRMDMSIGRKDSSIEFNGKVGAAVDIPLEPPEELRHRMSSFFSSASTT